jgi:hypothetical protein
LADAFLLTGTITSTDPIIDSSTREDVNALIRGLQLDDPKLYEALRLLNDQVGNIAEKLSPLVRQALAIGVIGAPPDLSVTNFRAVSIGSDVRFDWDSTSTVPMMYEVREGNIAFVEDLWITYQSFNLRDLWKDTAGKPVPWYTPIIAENWDTASFRFRTGNLNAIIDPLLYGDHIFLLKTLNSVGAYSVNALSLHFLVTKIGSVVITKGIIDNNVLLYWNTPTSVFDIKEYRLYKDGVLKATVTSTFAGFFELVPGTYTYSIISVDVAGNLSDPTSITAFVNQPPDFALQNSYVSPLNGTRVNTLKTPGPKLLCNWLSETFQNHFVSRTWLTPNDQMNAGYPIYIQPTATTGSYEEVIDYGAVFSNIIVTVTWNANVWTPNDPVTALVRLASSTDNVTYSAFSNGASQFFPSFRYLKLRLEFTGSSNKALLEIYNLTVNLNVKREMDGGEVNAPLTDVNGTEVIFNKPFKDIESITCTVKSVKEPYMVIYNFVDIPNPVHFFVFVFDTAGNRATKVVEWKARGIV